MDKETVLNQLLALKGMKLEELLPKYKEIFKDQKPGAINVEYLRKQIAYKLQELAYGGLPNEARTRLDQLIIVYDPINNRLLRKVKNPNGSKTEASRDRRLPIPGSIITKIYKGTPIKVKVLEKGFEYEDKHYRTLSQVANVVTGDHWNGFLFFNL